MQIIFRSKSKASNKKDEKNRLDSKRSVSSVKSAFDEPSSLKKPADQEFNDEAERLFRQLNNLERGQRRPSIFRRYDPVYEDASTGARVYVGGKSFAEDIEELRAFKITHILNCTTDIENKFANDGITYKRFCVGTWDFNKKYDVEKPAELLAFVDSALDFVDMALENKQSVLIHCLAGAHRAGTTAVLFFMGKNKLNSADAHKLAKTLRKLINPIGRLKVLLEKVDEAVNFVNSAGIVDKQSRWYREELFLKDGISSKKRETRAAVNENVSGTEVIEEKEDQLSA